MKLKVAASLFCCLICLEVGVADGADAHTVKGVVITPDGTVVPEFTLVVKPVSDKPELARRKHFTTGEFLIDRLEPAKYNMQISSPRFAGASLDFELKSASNKTDYRIVILYPYRNEYWLAPVKTPQQRIPYTARAAYTSAVQFHREGKLNEALIEYGRALRSFPQYLDALTDMGSIFLQYNRPEAALMFLRRAQDVDQSNPIVNLNIAVALTGQGDYDDAIKLLKKVLHRDPHLAPAQFFIAKIHYLQQEYEPAETYVRQALQNDPKLLDAWLLLIRINIEQERYSGASEGLQRIREAIRDQKVTEFIDEQLSALENPHQAHRAFPGREQ